MKVEQQSTEGMAGILVSIDESGPTGIHYIQSIQTEVSLTPSL